ncbi:unnamed protein product [Lactuca virosa]|uniref:Reverse transcriptase zinc-binding domain-containing protein n=1 Tax=Lactuca virosa TaxID=75947 RepID=A0AAU9P970_9ASTR|nr:unnamed protein product [Lactuca virosa]
MGFRFNLNQDETYLVKVMRRLIDDSCTQTIGNLICWSNLIPLKVKCFILRANIGRIPTSDALSHMGISVIHPNCHLCGCVMETVNHHFFECSFAKYVWYWIVKWCDILDLRGDNIRERMEFAQSWGNCPHKRDTLNLNLYSTIWNIWLARNEKIFNKKQVSPTKTTDAIIFKVLNG